ncbi:MAG TPA: carbohydrate ABC transporter permease [Streptosporangiaceae bacterium]|nr:carbohydrate ABC transporter permease [Streptosporangiaceae bacterium]
MKGEREEAGGVAVNARERLGRAVGQAAAGRPGRVVSAAPARLIGRLIAIIVILLWSLFPIYWALNTSFTTLSGADSAPSHYFPSPLVGTSYSQILGISSSSFGIATQLGRSLLNSAIESGAAMVLTVGIAVFAAYAFARLEFRFKRVIFVSVLATLLLPAYATLIPLYRIMASLGLVNTYLAVILVYVSGFLPLAIWILYNYFNAIPKELEEAAFVDGASPVRALLRVVVPVAMPGIAAAAIISFLMGWAQFLFPLVLTTDLSTQPVTVIVAALNQQRIVPFTLLMACGALAAAVPGILALILNRYIVEGITAGSVK